MKHRYICIKDTLIYLSDVNVRCAFKVGDYIDLEWAYEERYLVFIDDRYCGDFFENDMKNFEPERVNKIDKLLK